MGPHARPRASQPPTTLEFTLQPFPSAARASQSEDRGVFPRSRGLTAIVRNHFTSREQPPCCWYAILTRIIRYRGGRVGVDENPNTLTQELCINL